MRFGVFELDVRAGELCKQGHRIRLQEQPCQILAMLLERPGEVVTREELHQKLWPSDTLFVDFDHGLNNAINRLREALGDPADNPRFIETLPRRGYRFLANVQEVEAPAHPRLTPVPPSEPSPSIPSTEPEPRRLESWTWRAGLVLMGILAIFFLLNVDSVRQHLWRGPARAQARSLVVLPLENLSGDPSQDYFADGMTDELTTNLAQISSLRVISRTSAMPYKGKHKPLPQIARELNVDAVVEGTVVRSGNRVRISARLIDAQNDQHLWAQSYERDLRDVVSLQDEIARAIADEVRVQLTPQEQTRLARAKPVNPDAYENYLRGRYYLQIGTSEGTDKALAYFQKALEEDPNYALAYAGLATVYSRSSFVGGHAPREAMPKAEAAARKALELDETLAEAHAALAPVKFRYHWDWRGAEAEHKRALELNPNLADGHFRYAVFLRTANRYQEAIEEARRGQELDPASTEQRAGVGGAYLIARQYDQAIQELQLLAATHPESAWPCRFLGVAYEQKGEARKAIEVLEGCVEISHGDQNDLAKLGHAYAVLGRKQEAEKILAGLMQRSRREYVSPYNIALVWTGLGNKRQAMAWLEKAYEDRSFALVTINSWPWFDPLRSDPRFRNLVQRIGLDPDKAIPK
ncbi:MAG: FlgO family outer membrane protein [Terriglobales bacterium]